MSAECLPFAQIPHTSRLFLDYLAFSGAAPKYFSRPPLARDWFSAEAGSLHYDAARRERVAAILERQNRAWGAGQATLANIARLRNGAAVVVTGQQVTLFGGPSYSLLKGLTAIKVAAEASAAGVDCVPVFWLASEDHDLAEANHVYLSRPFGSVTRLETASAGAENAPVGKIALGSDITGLVEKARGLLGESAAAELLAECYQPGETFAGAFARIFIRLFAGFGLIVMDPADAELHAIAAPVLRSAIVAAAELRSGLMQRARQLEADSYHAQVMVSGQHTLLFALDPAAGGSRTAIRQQNGDFVLGGARLSLQPLQERIVEHPEQFSPNALLRPAMQDFLLPTLCAVGGPAEVAYFAQAAVVYEELLGRVTPILPRISATLVEPRVKRLLEKYRLALPELFHGEAALQELLAQRSIPGEVQQQFAASAGHLEQALGPLTAALERFDPTLASAAATSGKKMRYQLERLRVRAARSLLLREELLRRHGAELSASLFPHKNLQERVVAGIQLVSDFPELLQQLSDRTSTTCPDHQVLVL